MRYLIAIGFFGALVFLYIFLFLANRRTPVPKGCEDLKAQCNGCHDTACMNHPSHQNKNINRI